MTKNSIGWSIISASLIGGIALALTVAMPDASAAERGLDAQAERDDEAEPCGTDAKPNKKLNKKIKKLKKRGLGQFALGDAKQIPEGVVVEEAGVTFDAELWTLEDVGDGLVSIAAKKKPKTSEPETYMTCLCGGSDTAGGCLTMVGKKSGNVTCQDTGCTNRGCGIAIFGDKPALTDVGFEF